VRLDDVDEGLVIGVGEIDLQALAVLETDEEAVREVVVERFDVLGHAPFDVHDGVDLLLEQEKLVDDVLDVVLGGGFLELEADDVPEVRRPLVVVGTDGEGSEGEGEKRGCVKKFHRERLCERRAPVEHKINMSDWDTFQKSVIRYADLGFTLDTSRMNAPTEWPEEMRQKIGRAHRDRAAIEAGEIMNPDEGRMVGHYWLRDPDLAPAEEGAWIRQVNEDILAFAGQIHRGEITAPNGETFRHVLLIGIGGSALGPQLMTEALLPANSPIDIHFFDNTDPGGMDDVFTSLGDGLAETLVIVISKSGGTAETRNGMLETERKFGQLGLDFPKHAVAVTGPGSKLDRHADEAGWLVRFPMSDWVGGRTSVMSAVGLLPAALLGLNVAKLLEGAALMDAHTRSESLDDNAALALALMWWHAGEGRGKRDMVILPYCDRLELFSRYLQQLVMESLGKEFELGNETIAHQGIAVYGNKGSTDQHAYVQQLRDGLDNFFVTFIEVGATRRGDAFGLDELGSTASDYLQGFLRGTRDALYEKGRPSLTISIGEVNARTLGALIALFERAVSFYASLVNVNAYHQPGVEAGKKAAGAFLDLLARVKRHLAETGSGGVVAAEMAANLGESDVERVYHALNHLAATGFCRREDGEGPAEDGFFC